MGSPFSILCIKTYQKALAISAILSIATVLLLPYNKLLLIFISFNLSAFILCGVDKLSAGTRVQRIPEAAFITLAFVGSGAGLFLGMNFFRHKTLHWYFRWIAAFTAAFQIGLVWWLWKNFAW